MIEAFLHHLFCFFTGHDWSDEIPGEFFGQGFQVCLWCGDIHRYGPANGNTVSWPAGWHRNGEPCT